MAERLQKILSQWGIASRRKTEQMIKERKIKLNNQIAKLGDKIDIKVDKLEINGQTIEFNTPPEKIYLLLNKPLGVVSTCFDPQNRPTVIDLIEPKLKKGYGIHPIGRLDKNSTGALILTNDGNLTSYLTHPRYHLPKTYHVWLDGRPKKDRLQQWRSGINLEGKMTLPAKVRILKQQGEETLIEVILVEGRNRQIRKIAQILGYKVISLHRISIGSISLENDRNKSLPLGNYRHLSSKEIKFLQNNFRLKSVNFSGSNI